MDPFESRERDDVLLHELPSGLTSRQPRMTVVLPPTPAPELMLYVVSLFGVENHNGERIDGDALIVRAPDQPDSVLLAAVLGCTEQDLPALLDKGGSWAIRQIRTIDGYQLRFEGR